MADTSRPVLGILVSALAGLVFGGVFVAAGFWVRASTQPLADGVVVTAEVVDVEQSTDSDGDTMYSPVVEYVDPATGQTHRLGSSSSSSSRPAIGSTEEVSLLAGDPSTARVVGPVWFPWVFVAVGAMVIAVTLSSFFKALFGTPTANDDEEFQDSSSREWRTGGTEGAHTWTIEDLPKIIDV